VEDEEDDPMDGTVSAQRSQQAKLPTPQPPAGLQMPAGSIPVATSAARTMVPPPASSSAGPATVSLLDRHLHSHSIRLDH
jgi:hypothetical protein